VAAKDWNMPPNIRNLIAELERAGFVNHSGKGSHRNFVHPDVKCPVTISDRPGDDAKHYQVRVVRLALEELMK
jgi:predicted RNA binding protein YcfA (HicA-like mRNA interferase family)